MVDTHLLEIKYDGETVAYIDQAGDYVCLDKELTVRTLRLSQLHLANLAIRIKNLFAKEQHDFR